MGGGASKEELKQVVADQIAQAKAEDDSSSSGFHFLEIHSTSAFQGAGILLVLTLSTLGLIAMLVGCIYLFGRYKDYRCRQAVVKKAHRRAMQGKAIEMRRLSRRRHDSGETATSADDYYIHGREVAPSVNLRLDLEDARHRREERRRRHRRDPAFRHGRITEVRHERHMERGLPAPRPRPTAPPPPPPVEADIRVVDERKGEEDRDSDYLE